MKTILILVAMLATLLLSGCNPFEDKEKAAEITRLEIALASQHGTRVAEIEYAERQVSVYLGCKAFFNRCSPETIERGQTLLARGFTGTTSLWYLGGLLGELICIAIAVAVAVTFFMHLFLVFIAPNAVEVERSQKMIDGMDEYVAEGERRRVAIDQHVLTQNGELAKINSSVRKQKKELHEDRRKLREVNALLESAIEKQKAEEQKTINAEDFGDY